MTQALSNILRRTPRSVGCGGCAEKFCWTFRVSFQDTRGVITNAGPSVHLCKRLGVCWADGRQAYLDRKSQLKASHWRIRLGRGHIIA